MTSNFDPEFALADLLKAGIVFTFADDKGMIGLAVNANDTFGPVADAEPLPMAELPKAYREFCKSGDVIFWLCERRRLQPWQKLKGELMANGQWNDAYKALPENPI